MKFQDLPVGARFEYQGKVFVKTGPITAASEAGGQQMIPRYADLRPLDRPEALPGQTYKLRWPDSEHALYITINDIIQDGRRRPFEEIGRAHV